MSAATTTDLGTKTLKELQELCRERGLSGYSGRKKQDVLALLTPPTPPTSPPPHVPSAANTANAVPLKKSRGQFYTTNADYILAGLPTPPTDARCILEPFAGQGDLLEWVAKTGTTLPVEAYDIEPKRADIQRRDTLRSPPTYADAWILTNPPYLARNKCAEKDIFDLYETNDLYKCFLTSLVQQATPARGGILIIPAGFFFSPRNLDVRCRGDFMRRYRITRVRYFEETVFADTSVTVVAVAFEWTGEEYTEQDVVWELLPVGEVRTFRMAAAHQWIVGGDIYDLPVAEDGTQVRRHVEGHPLLAGEQQTHMTLNAVDSGTQEGRISMEYKAGYVYPAQECARTYATLRLRGPAAPLSAQQQVALCAAFNTFVEQKRTETWSLFLPQFRESKEYARKRIPFELAYRIVLHLLPTIVAANQAK